MVGNPRIPASADVPLSELLQRCGTGDAVSFRALYERQSGRLYGIALRITRQPALAADALHEALMQVWQHANRFDPARGSPEAWLTGLIRYRAMDIVRKHGREGGDAAIPDSADEAPGPLDALLASRDGKALHDCIATLEAAQRRAILLAFVDGLTHSEISARISAPLGTVKSWVRRGLLALKECLGP
ncbi:MAG: sigma-70 family RNA polymerase sigma factor [Acetobacteraceae bacterium]|nr:sigma-70 family RNA polymerase sigma factor [Acetobacteraceae bacterium]